MSDVTWTSARTVDDADALARATVDQVISARGWSGADIALSQAPLNAARDNSSDAATYWAALSYAWDEAGRIAEGRGLVLPPGWGKLPAVWAGAAETMGYSLSAEDANSLSTILGGAIVASAEQATQAATVAANASVGILTWVNKHPYATIGIVVFGILLWQAAPQIAGAVAARAVVR